MERNTIIGLIIAALAVIFTLRQGANTQPTRRSPSAATTASAFGAVLGTPIIDGIGDDEVWTAAAWQPLNQVWLGETPLDPADFSGRYKVAWDENNLYLLVEVVDDVLRDTHPNGLEKYWDDDCLEVFLDEDASGGDHQYNYNAFAYHLSLSGKVADIGPDKQPHFYDDHCVYKVETVGGRSVWEVAIKVFDGKRYVDGGDNIPKLLRAGKKMGFALAYCDNDHSEAREHFIGNVPIAGADKNRGWIDASVFGMLELAPY